ncbi:MAG: hypothetical protein ACFFEU_04460 [Candidatus Thorarchaeota archaeon]
MGSGIEKPVSDRVMASPDTNAEAEGCCIVSIIVSIIIAILGMFSPISPADPNSSIATPLTFGLAAVSFSLLYVGIQIRNASLREL